MKKIALTGIPGKLVSSSRMSFSDTANDPNAPRQSAEGTIELMADGSPVHLLLKK